MAAYALQNMRSTQTSDKRCRLTFGVGIFCRAITSLSFSRSSVCSLTGKVFAPGTLIRVLASNKGSEGLPLPAIAGLAVAAAEPFREREEERGEGASTIIMVEVDDTFDLRPLLSEDEAGAGDEPFARFLEEDRVAIILSRSKALRYA